jgi:uncharacterized protein YoxC
MTNLHKAFWHSEDNSIKLSMPIAKVDKERRMVSGFATLDNVDKQSDIVPTDVSIKAFERFRGNLREMHMPIAVGRVMSFKSDKFYDKQEDKFYNGVYVDAYISKGAQDTWEKVLDGTLSGFSIGGSIKDTEDQYDPEMDKSIRVIKDYDLHELSLVDNPANQFANIVSIQKAEDGQNTFDGIMTKMSLENVYWSKDNSLIRLSKEEDPRSGEVLIGFVETTDSEKSQTIKNLIKAHGTITNEDTINMNAHSMEDCEDPENCPNHMAMYHDKKKKDEDMDKASNVRVGDMVSWNSSGGTARGKVTRVVRNGKIKVPNSSFTITGTPEDPAVAIRIYRDGKPTDTIVGHKMKTLRRSSSKAEGIDLSSDNSKKEGNEMAKTKQESAPVAEETKVEKTVTAEDEVVVVDEIVKSESGDAEAPAEAAAEAVETAEVEAPAEAEAVEAAEAPAETEVAVEDAATPTEEAEKTIEATDLEKAVETVQTSVDEVSKSVTTAVGDLVATVKSINDQIAELTKSIANVNEEIKNIKGNVEEFGKRVDAVEDDTAIRKSGDLGGVVQENKIQKRSMWGGRFLNSADLYR